MSRKRISDLTCISATALVAVVPIMAIYAPGRPSPSMFSLVLFFSLVIALRKAFEAQFFASIAFLVCALQSASLSLEFGDPLRAEQIIVVSPTMLLIVCSLIGFLIVQFDGSASSAFQKEFYSSVSTLIILILVFFAAGWFILGARYPLDNEVVVRVIRNCFLIAGSLWVVRAAWGRQIGRIVICFSLCISLLALTFKELVSS